MGGWLEALHFDFNRNGARVERQATVCFVAVQQSSCFPNAVFITTLLGGKELAAYPGELAGQVKYNAGIDTRHEEFIGSQLSDQRSAVRILIARWATSILLREAVTDRYLPRPEVDLLRRFSVFFHCGFDFAIK